MTTNILTCDHCDHNAEDVRPVAVYVGGRGYETRLRCSDEVACWARWDSAHGFTDTEAQRLVAERQRQAEAVIGRAVRLGDQLEADVDAGVIPCRGPIYRARLAEVNRAEAAAAALAPTI